MPNDQHGPVTPQGGVGKPATPGAQTTTLPSARPYKRDPGMDALGELICRLNPYTELPVNQNTGLSTGDMIIGMLPPADQGYQPPNSTIACMGIEVERNYKPVWTFKGQDQTVQTAVRIPYRFPVLKNGEVAYWQTEYLLLGFVGGGGMG
jgi:hypothetical protein